MSLSPFLKWPGGKRWFVCNCAYLLPATFNRYIEPFLGGGSVFFHLRPRRAIIGETNGELVDAYRGIQINWQEVERLLIDHQRKHSASHYYSVRASNPVDPAERSARLIYLNRTCFNGIYRVNFEGKFNVPMGDRTLIFRETDDFRDTSRALEVATIRQADFEDLVDSSKPGDLIFADPPYTVRHNLNGFIRYNEQLFSWSDQVRLADALSRAKERGSKVVSTNANHTAIKTLYAQRGFELKVVSRFSGISADPKSRRQFEELVVIG